MGGPNGFSPALLEKVYPQEEVLGTGGNNDLVCYGGETCTAYGFSTYVMLVASNDEYRVTTYGASTDASLKAKILSGTLLDINTGNPVPTGDLYVGNWQVFVITDYFKDDLDGTYNNGLAGLDIGDQLIYRDVSNVATWIVTKNPYIQNVDPNPVAGGATATVTGANFGVSGVEILGDSIGDDDGKCEQKEKCEIRLCKKNTVPCTSPKYPKVMSWSDTSIVIKIPTMAAPWPKKKDVEVTVPGAPTPKSNMYQITIVKPGTY